MATPGELLHMMESLEKENTDLRHENQRLRYLLRCSCRVYHGAENMDGKPLQWIGVHVVRWPDHPALPTVGFVQWDDEEIEAELHSPKKEG